MPGAAGVLRSAVQRSATRPALGSSTVNFATTEAIDDVDVHVSSAGLAHRNGALVSIDFAVHYVVRAPCPAGRFSVRRWSWEATGLLP